MRLFQATALAIYGPEHPLSFSAGGLPAALRVIRPTDIRRFHAQHYFLGNIGLIAALPNDVALTAALERFDAVLKRLEPRPPSLKAVTENDLPLPRPAPAGRMEYVPYPFRNDQQPSSVAMIWPAERKLEDRDIELFSLFLDNFAGDPDTNLYRRLIDTRTREVDFGATGVAARLDSGQGFPVYLRFRDVPVARMNDRDLGMLRSLVVDEFARIAAYPGGSAELTAFNERLKGRILQRRRELAKFVNTPPGFGFRGTGANWVMHLYQLNKDAGFRKSLTKRGELDDLDKLIAGGRNIWRDYLAQWKINGVTPWIEAAKPDPDLLRQEEADREARASAEVARLKAQYGLSSDQEAIRRYQSEYDAASRALESSARHSGSSKFVDNPPRTLDDQLKYSVSQLARGVPLVTSRFDSMTSATAGVALRLDSVPEDRLVYVSLLPQLLTTVGVIENGKPVSYQEMSGRLRREILGLEVRFGVNPRTDRYELVVRGSGSNVGETRRALEWMKLTLWNPDWRTENLPRLRDVIDQALGAIRNTPQRAEEAWVEDPALAYRRQDNPLFLATSSFMTREHNIFRLRWLLRGGGSEEVYWYLNRLADVSGGRTERKAILASIEAGKNREVETLSPPAKPVVMDAARDLDAILAQVPDASLAADWSGVCRQMVRDLEIGPEKALAAIDAVRRSLLTAGGARMFLIGSPATEQALAADLAELPQNLADAAVKKAVYRASRRIDERLGSRDPLAAHPVFVGLLNANSQGGVFLNSAPGASFQDTAPDALLDFVAANLYAGHGAHSMFMKTWGAGLAYSNGIRIKPLEGRINYYAERTPELPQTLKFVIGQLKKAHADPGLPEYAIANAFDGSRAGEPYETRGEAMAADLADGLVPNTVARFRQGVLALRQRPDLTKELFRRLPAVYGTILPGFGIRAEDVPGGVYFVIGPEKQLNAYEEYLKSVEGPETRLFWLYARDFWLN
jgi:hypothetical protein